MGSQSARPAADRFLVQQFVYVLGHSSHIEINKLAFQFLMTVQDLGIIVVFPLFPEIPLSLGSLPIILDPLSQSFCPALSPPSSLRQWVSSLLILPPHHPCWGPPDLCFQRRALSRTPSRISGCLSAASRGTSGGALDLLCPPSAPSVTSAFLIARSLAKSLIISHWDDARPVTQPPGSLPSSSSSSVSDSSVTSDRL